MGMYRHDAAPKDGTLRSENSGKETDGKTPACYPADSPMPIMQQGNTAEGLPRRRLETRSRTPPGEIAAK
jgi:hypothetical protein